MKINIKNMVCARCLIAVRNVFEKHNMEVDDIRLGEVTILADEDDIRLGSIEDELNNLGFEILGDKKSKTIEKVKNEIIRLVRERHNELRINLSEYLSQALFQDYGTMSQLFSDVEGTTIEQYYIRQKIEYVKELLTYDELTVSQIADMLHYSSVAHLSSQFKKVTGLTTSHFKTIGRDKRKRIEEI